MSKEVDNLVKALQAGITTTPDGLVGGAALQVEELDLAGIGMYSQEQKDNLLLEGVPEDDFFLNTIMGTTMWARKSDEGTKWHIYDSKNLKLWKDIK